MASILWWILRLGIQFLCICSPRVYEFNRQRLPDARDNRTRRRHTNARAVTSRSEESQQNRRPQQLAALSFPFDPSAVAVNHHIGESDPIVVLHFQGMYSGPAALTQGPAAIPAKKDRRRRHMKCIQRKKDEKVLNGEETGDMDVIVGGAR